MKRIFLIFLIIISLSLPLIYLSQNKELFLVYDDSYITLTFAKNFFKYKGLTFDGKYYNEGATSPLHIFLIAFLDLFFHNLPLSNILLGIFSYFLLIFLTYKYYKLIFDEKIALISSFLTATTGLIIFDALSGLETILFIDFILLTLYFFEKKSFLFGIFLALTIYTRPDGIFLGIALFVYFILKRSKIKEFFPFIISFLILLPFFINNYKNTNSFLPQTGIVKAHFFDEINLPIRTKLQFFFDGLKLFYYQLLYPFSFLFFIFLPFAKRLYEKYYHLIFIFFFYLSYLILFPGSTGHYWCRYQHIFYPFVIGVISLGIKNFSKKRKIFYFLLFLIILNQFLSIIDNYHRYNNSLLATKEVLYDMSNYFKEKTDKNSVIATHDVGALKYFSEREILDLVGLTNPEMRRFYKNIRRNERDIKDYVIKNANYLVMFDFFKIFLNFSPKDDTNFIYLGRTKSLFGLNQFYEIYGILK
ncbi:MAG: glycosyltransferase family 39 protein [candidate division WOR-3 bacterium]|nr:glycosyltransferase family 39 protein [candidate division WOR-3 bacterium]MDW8113936.1 glycosyltransferase family 39 protein [candidate division WOR-3 bacterium]